MFVHRGYLGRIDTDPASGRPRGRIARHGGDLPFAADPPAIAGAAFRAAVDAYLAGLPAVRIIHGHGTGAVRQAVRELLSRHPAVQRWEPADRRQGGDGATEVTLAQ